MVVRTTRRPRGQRVLPASNMNGSIPTCEEKLLSRQLRDVVFVDGVRTPFGKAKGQYAETRADDLVIKCIRELIRRNPELPPE